MATTSPAKNRYTAALRYNTSPSAMGRSKVLEASLLPPPPPPPPPQTNDVRRGSGKKKSTRVESRWQAATQEQFSNSRTRTEIKDQHVEVDVTSPSVVPKMFSVTSPRVPLPPPPPPAAATSSSSRHRRHRSSSIDRNKEAAPQLMHQKKQWNADTAIPRGMVANSPFRPAKAPPPPQLRQQKQQWDAQRDIPKGTVQERIPADAPETKHKEMTDNQKKLQWNIERDIPKGAVSSRAQDKVWSPHNSSDAADPVTTEIDQSLSSEAQPFESPAENQKKLQWDVDHDIAKSAVNSGQKDPDEIMSPRNSTSVHPPKSPRRDGWITHGPQPMSVELPRMTATDVDVKAADSPKRQWGPEAAIPRGAVSNSAGKINRIFFVDSPEEPLSPQLQHQKKQWEPENDIPRGKVRGISNLFDSGAISPQFGAVQHAAPIPALEHTDQYLEPVEPAQASPPHASPRVVKPTPIPASRSEDDFSPSAQSNEQTVYSVEEQIGASKFRKSPLRTVAAVTSESDPWMIPSTSSDGIFGDGTWGEEVNPSRSLDEYDERDWFQSGSFNTEEEQTGDDEFSTFESGAFTTTGAFSSEAEMKRDTELDDSDHDDDFIPGVDTGSFAAAIQPVTSSRRINTKPETVLEDLEEDAASEFNISAVTKKTCVVNLDSANSLKLTQMLESNVGVLNQPSDSRSVTSGNSKKSKGGFRKKSEKKPDTPNSEKKRRGLFKLFSGRKQGTPRTSEKVQPSEASSDADSSRVTPKGRTPRSLRKAKSPPVANNSSSLTKLTADVEKARSHGVISTRDDVSAVSEMTNSTVFLTKAASNEEHQLSRTLSPEAKPSLRAAPSVSPHPQTPSSLSVKTAREDSTAAEPDPFDIMSPMFSNGDPWSPVSGMEHKPETSPSDAFTDPFFSSSNVRDGEHLKDDSKAATCSEINHKEAPSVSEHDIDMSDATIAVALFEEDLKENASAEGSRKSNNAEVYETTNDDDISSDAPDPELQIMSSDDEVENDDPATKSEVVSGMDSQSKSPAKSQERRTKNLPVSPMSIDPKLGFVSAPLDELNVSAQRDLIRNERPPPTEKKSEHSRSATSNLARRSREQRPQAKQSEAVVPLHEMMRDAPASMKSTEAPPVASMKSSHQRVGTTSSSQYDNFDGSTRALGKSTHTIDSVESEETLSKLLQNTAGSNLTYKMRMKRYEKKMQRAKATEERERRNVQQKPQDEHISTSAYLTRFKSKSSNKVKVASVHKNNRASTGTPQSSRSPFQAFADPLSLSRSSIGSDIDSVPSVEAKGSKSSGSRSSRRNLRSKAKGGASLEPAPKSFNTESVPLRGAHPAATKTSGRSAPVSKLQEEIKCKPPRSILKKLKGNVSSTVRQLSPTSSKDPMHRAGLRLLALAVIPIQTEMRRFLAKRETLNRMWAIIVIQASARRWLAQTHIDREDEAALIIQTYFADYLTREYARVLIQSHVRRWLVEKSLQQMFAAVLIQAQFRGWVNRRGYREHKSATTIQARVRSWALVKEYTKLIAAIRIQSSIRGQIARKHFEKEVSALRIQSCFRGWIGYKSFWQQVLAAIQIQAVFRGWFTRDSVADQHYCATQIQRIFRGYVSTMAVYEDIYKVTLVQSFVRMKIAMDATTYKLAFIIQMQSISRGFLVRKKLERMNAKAVTMQRLWRGHSSRLNYQFDLLDIILLQSVFRRKVAMRELEGLKQALEIESATVIQTRWRSYDCTMNYLHYLADVLIVQSAVRRWVALKHAKECRRDLEYGSATAIQARSRGFLVRNSIERNSAASSIQRTWRGFVSYAEYMFNIADIVITQTQVRCWVARRKHNRLLQERDTRSAITIQTQWRRHVGKGESQKRFRDIVVCQSTVRRVVARREFRTNLLEKCAAETIQRAWWSHVIWRDEKSAGTSIQRMVRGYAQRNKYAIEIQEHRSSVKIQTAWRQFWLFSNFVIMLDSAIIIQSLGRSYLASTDLKRKQCSATVIQSKVRSVMGRRTASAKSMVKALLSTSAAIGGRQIDAALMIQTNWRSSNARNRLFKHRRARAIQTVWRRVGPRRALLQYIASVRLQACWRRQMHYNAYTQYRSATKVQTLWRACVARRTFNVYIGARKIQTAWRMASAHAICKRFLAARRIETAWRCYIAREKYVTFLLTIQAATMIQSAWRSFICYTDYIFTLSDIVTVQRIARGFIHRKLYARKCDEKRGRELEDTERNNCAKHIQRMYRGSSSRILYRRLVAALTIQRVFRGGSARLEVELIKQYLAHRRQKSAAAVQIQTLWRGYDQKQKFWYLLGCIIQIQCVARGFVTRLQYKDDIGCVIVAQSLARRWITLKQYNQMLLIEALIDGAKHEEIEKQEAATALQHWYKNNLRPRIRIAAAVKVQSFFRMVKAMVDTEIKAEKRRRKIRRKLRKRTKEVEEAVLEGAWEYVSLSGRPSKDESANDFEQGDAATATDNVFNNVMLGYRSRSAPRQGRQDNSSGRNHIRSKSRDSSINRNESFDLSKGSRKLLLPPSYYDVDETEASGDRPTDMVRLRKPEDDSDALSEVSGLTTQSVIRPPPSRLKRMGNKDMAEDLSLEEAWVDMEIQNTKQKRKTTAKGRKHLVKGLIPPRAIPHDQIQDRKPKKR